MLSLFYLLCYAPVLKFLTYYAQCYAHVKDLCINFGCFIRICTTLTPQIKGKCGATNLMFPFAPGQHHDVALEGGIPFL